MDAQSYCLSIAPCFVKGLPDLRLALTGRFKILDGQGPEFILIFRLNFPPGVHVGRSGGSLF